jgi:hypothetical protein
MMATGEYRAGRAAGRLPALGHSTVAPPVPPYSRRHPLRSAISREGSPRSLHSIRLSTGQVGMAGSRGLLTCCRAPRWRRYLLLAAPSNVWPCSQGSGGAVVAAGVASGASGCRLTTVTIRQPACRRGSVSLLPYPRPAVASGPHQMRTGCGPLFCAYLDGYRLRSAGCRLNSR